MNDNKVGIIVGSFILLLATILSVNASYQDYLNHKLEVSKIAQFKTLLDSCYTKKVVGCEVQVFDYVKEN